MRLAATLDAAVTPDDVAFTYAVRNEGTDPVGFQFPSAQAVEVLVFERTPDGDVGAGDPDQAEPVWRFGANRSFAQVTSEASLEPGESLVRTADWSSPDPGAYRAVASLTVSSDARAETTFAVESP